MPGCLFQPCKSQLRLAAESLNVSNIEGDIPFVLFNQLREHRFGLYDGVVPQQGPNYALAKRIQKWRALAARAAGHRVSANVTPSNSTRSVLTRRDFAAAYAGARYYCIEIFEPATTNAIMAALLVHDLCNGDCTANPAVELTHPLTLFMDEAVHGGLWRTGLQPRSVPEIAAVRGFLGSRH